MGSKEILAEATTQKRQKVKGWTTLRHVVRVPSLMRKSKEGSRSRRESQNQHRDSFMERFSTQRRTVDNHSGPDEDDPEYSSWAVDAIKGNHHERMAAAKLAGAFESARPPNSEESTEDQQIICCGRNTGVAPADVFLFEPHGKRLLVWLTILSMAILYNCWFAIVRQVFRQFEWRFRWVFIGLDLVADALYIVDIVVQSRTTYLEQGLVVKDRKKLCKHYMKSIGFRLDLVTLLPLDLLQIFLGLQPLLRFPRFLKIYRAHQWKMKIENRSLVPNVWRVINLIHLLFLSCHWFGCIYYQISKHQNFSTEWGYQDENDPNIITLTTYLKCYFWATLALTTIGIEGDPVTNIELMYTCLCYLLGLFAFATVVGQVGTIINTRNAARIAFEEVLDNVKTYMRKNSINPDLQKRILRWYDYAWEKQMDGVMDLNNLAMLPTKLKAELAININLTTLKRVSIFKECRPEFLNDLVLKMRPYIFIPGDYICRTGEIAREMFIVAEGVVQVIGANNVVLKELKSGDFFGEIGILQVGGSNRRLADVRAVGYADLFGLSRADVLDALEDHPEAEAIIMRAARQRMQETTKIETDDKTKAEISGETRNREPSTRTPCAGTSSERPPEEDRPFQITGDRGTMETQLSLFKAKYEEAAQHLNKIMNDMVQAYELCVERAISQTVGQKVEQGDTQNTRDAQDSDTEGMKSDIEEN